MAYRVCSTSGCGVLHQGTGRCPSCRADADKKRRPKGNPYSTRGHQAFREGVLAKHPRCVCRGECGKHDTMCARPSTVADHWPLEREELIAAGMNPNDPRHGRGLCAPCHGGKTARTRPGGWNDTSP
jgi:5-methylcytosine-specific restriction protein A